MSILVREWELVRKMFANGGRWLIIANFYFAAAIAVLTVVIVVTQCSATDTYSPLRNPSPQLVAEEVVEQGGLIHVTAEKCNDSDEDVVFDRQTSWRRQSDRILIPRSTSMNNVREPGCTTTVFENPIPIDLPVGMWRIEGVEVARTGGETQVTAWRTEYFEVVEGERE